MPGIVPYKICRQLGVGVGFHLVSNFLHSVLNSSRPKIPIRLRSIGNRPVLSSSVPARTGIPRSEFSGVEDGAPPAVRRQRRSGGFTDAPGYAVHWVRFGPRVICYARFSAKAAGGHPGGEWPVSINDRPFVLPESNSQILTWRKVSNDTGQLGPPYVLPKVEESPPIARG